MNQSNHLGILITNLGSPASTSIPDVSDYLTEFLMDKNVIDYPYLLRWFLVHKIVVPRRAPDSAQAYKKVWQPAGSPLIIFAEKLKEKIQNKTSLPVALSMRYGQPSTEQAFAELLQKDPQIRTVAVLPLYPQYTMSSYGTAVEQIMNIHRQKSYPFDVRFLHPFYNHPDYIACLSATIKPFIEQEYDKILFSYHGIPERHIHKDAAFIKKGVANFQLPSVTYEKQARETSRLVAEYLSIPQDKYEVSFQSRLTAAGQEWIKPYTIDRLPAFPNEGVKNLIVVCPAFINDCLETIDEIGYEGKEIFEKAGGEKLTLVPCINDQDQFAETVVKWICEGQ